MTVGKEFFVDDILQDTIVQHLVAAILVQCTAVKMLMCTWLASSPQLHISKKKCYHLHYKAT